MKQRGKERGREEEKWEGKGRTRTEKALLSPHGGPLSPAALAFEYRLL